MKKYTLVLTEAQLSRVEQGLGYILDQPAGGDFTATDQAVIRRVAHSVSEQVVAQMRASGNGVAKRD